MPLDQNLRQQKLEEHYHACRAMVQKAEHELRWAECDYEEAKREGNPKRMGKARRERNEAEIKAQKARAAFAEAKYLAGM
jgi:hypothetical protein